MLEIWIPIAAIIGLILGLALGFWGGFLFASGKNRMLEAKARAEVQTEYQERLVSLEADARSAKEGQQILETQIAGMKEGFELEKRQILDRFGNEKTEITQKELELVTIWSDSESARFPTNTPRTLTNRSKVCSPTRSA